MSTTTADFEQLVALMAQLERATPDTHGPPTAGNGKMDESRQS